MINIQAVASAGRQALASAAVLALLAACAVAPPPTRELIAPPDVWAAKGAGRSPVSCHRLQCFGIEDGPHNAIIESALAHNLDLTSAGLQARLAELAARIAAADRVPSVDAALGAGRQQQSVPDPLSGQSTDVLSQSFTASLNIRWEADLWGRVAANSRAAAADMRAEQARYNAARLSLSGQTAKAWFAVVEAQQQLRLAQDTAIAYEETARITRDRVDTGVASPSDGALATSNLESARATVARRQQAVGASRRQLELLLGRYPAAAIVTHTELPRLLPPPAPDLPLSVLSRRPDLLAAEQALLAATERYNVARLALYPRLDLSAGGGAGNSQLSALLDGDDSMWNLGANLMQPLFNRGRLLRLSASEKLRIEQSTARFRQAALVAFSEVERSLMDETLLATRAVSVQRAADAASDALRIASDRYASGVDSFLVLLESQRRHFDAQSQGISTRRERLDNRIDFYLALGGGIEQLP